MKKCIVGVLLIVLVTVAGFTMDVGVGAIGSLSVLTAPEDGFGYGFGFEMGLIYDSIELWPRMLIELINAGDVDYNTTTLGVEIIMGYIGVQLGHTGAMIEDNSTATTFAGFQFPATVVGSGFSAEVSAISVSSDLFILRPSLAYERISFQDGSAESFFKVRLALHLRGIY